MKTSVVDFEPVAGARAIGQAKANASAQRRTRGVLLMNLGRGQCRYAIGEDATVTGGHLFCAATTLPDRPYCEHHHRVVTAVEQRRARAGSAFRLRAA